jgi:hypothetical protein
MRELKLDNINKLNKEELRHAIADCFEYAPDATSVDRLAILQEAQLYTRELERREDSWISRRDLILEIVVIVLIGAELGLGYQQEREQSKAAALQQQVLTNLQVTSAAAAATMTATEAASELNNLSARRQNAFVDVMCDPMSSSIVVRNLDTSRITLTGYNFGNHEVRQLEHALVLDPGNTSESFETEELTKTIPLKPGEISAPFYTQFFATFSDNKGAVFFTVTELAATRVNNKFHIACGPTEAYECTKCKE